MIREVLTSARLRAMSPDEAAALWTLRLADGPPPHEREQFEEWLQFDLANAAAWSRSQKGWNAFEGAEADELLDAMRQHARAARPASNDYWRPLAAAAALFLVVGGGSIVADRAGLFERSAEPTAWAPPSERQLASAPLDFVNGRALPRTVTLPDGSRMTLDTQTHVVAVFRQSGRRLQVVNGRAFFDVQHDPSRPFVVRARDVDVTAIGTRFDVGLARGDVRVKLVDGRLAVARAGSASKPILMSGGQQLVAQAGSAPKLLRLDTDEALKWQQGFATFEDRTLAEAAADLNRYPGKRLVVRDPRVARLRVTGMFRAGDPERFGRTLEQIYPVRVVRKNGNELEVVPAG